MQGFGYGLSELIADLCVIIAEARNEREILEQARPLAEWVSQEPENWLPALRFEADSQRGFGVNLLHEEPGNTLTVCAVAWPPGGYVSPHDHHTWEILSPVYGAVRHSSWERSDSGSKPGCERIEKRSEFLMRPGQAAAVMPDEIHALENFGSSLSLTIHIYGCKLADVERGRFDPGLGQRTEISAQDQRHAPGNRADRRRCINPETLP